MRKRRVWRYYCDFCKKANCSAHATSEHEKHCTMNPERQCRMCKWQPRAKKLSVADLKKELEVSFARLRFMVQCPACILAAIKQSGKSPYDDYHFEYGKEAEAYWEKVKQQWEKEAEQQILAEMHGY
jgi:hypothetical protein